MQFDGTDAAREAADILTFRKSPLPGRQEPFNGWQQKITAPKRGFKQRALVERFGRYVANQVKNEIHNFTPRKDRTPFLNT